MTTLLRKVTSLSTLKLNILANYVGKYWSSFLGLLLVPVYLHYLGVESYGLIGAFTSLVSFLGLLDLGLSATVMREVALRNAVPERQATIPDLLRTVEVIYWGVGVGLLLLMLPLTQLIATNWLQADKLDLTTVKLSVLILGINLAVQWPKTPYFGTLMALEKQVAVNCLEGGLNTLRWLGAVVVLAWISPTLIAFLLWQTAIAILQVLLFWQLAWRVIPKFSSSPRFKWDILRQTWQYTAHMSGTTIVVLLLMQTDKILLSKLLSLEQFGYYVLANTLSNQLFQVFYPFVSALAPRLTALVAQEDERQLARVFHKSSLFVSVLTAPAAAALIFFAPLILELWTRSPQVAQNASAPLSLLVFGTLMNGMMHLPYQLQLAIGKPEIMFVVNICFVLILVPAIFVVVPYWGMAGAASIWAVLNTFYYIGISRITHHYVLRKEYLSWLIYDTFIPIMLSFAIMFGVWLISFTHEGKIIPIMSLGLGLVMSYVVETLWYKYRKL
jgi:O-antigen/teichoic acid export membrane protein